MGDFIQNLGSQYDIPTVTIGEMVQLEMSFETEREVAKGTRITRNVRDAIETRVKHRIDEWIKAGINDPITVRHMTTHRVQYLFFTRLQTVRK